MDKATEKHITDLRNRINELRKELELLQTADMDVPKKFTDFADNYFGRYGFLVFTMRDFRKKFHDFIGEVKTFTVNEVFRMLSRYCKNRDLFLFPHSRKEMEGIRYGMRFKGGGIDEYCCIVAEKDNEVLEVLSKKVRASEEKQTCNQTIFNLSIK